MAIAVMMIKMSILECNPDIYNNDKMSTVITTEGIGKDSSGICAFLFQIGMNQNALVPLCSSIRSKTMLIFLEFIASKIRKSCCFVTALI